MDEDAGPTGGLAGNSRRHTRGGARRPRVTVGLAYYSPYVSGLSEVARRFADELAERGYDVHVVTTRHDRQLARHAVLGGVGIRRCRTIGTLGRAPVSLSFPVSLIRAAWQSDVTLLHLPLPEAGLVSLFVPRSRLFSFYHCDPASLQVPGESIFRKLIDLSSWVAAMRSRNVVVTSEDYAASSRISAALLRRNVVVPPPCIERPEGRPTYRETDGLHVGFLGRVVAEKGVEYLVEGFRSLEDPDARLLIAGEFDEVAGGSVIRSVSRIAQGDSRIRFLGHVPEEALADFYASLDVFALPSVNSFEAFGIVQVEALMAGVPVVSTDLPGVRTVAPSLGAGVLVPPRDAGAIADVLRRREWGSVDRDAVRSAAVAAYGLESLTTRLESVVRPAVDEGIASYEQQRQRRRARRRSDDLDLPGLNAQFDDDPEGYAAIRQGWMFERRLRFVLQFLDSARPGDHVLEIGAGTGSLLERVAAARSDLTFQGVEPNARYAEYASERWDHQASGQLQMLHGSAETLGDLDVRPADFVLSCDVLHHVEDLRATSQSLFSAAEPWARWLALEPNPNNPWVRYYHMRTPGERVFPRRRFLEEAAAAGWKLSTAQHLFLVPQALRNPPSLLQHLESRFEHRPFISGGLALLLDRSDPEAFEAATVRHREGATS